MKDESWVVPIKLKGFEKYDNIGSIDTFNKIISNPNNAREILENENLLKYWIVPNAILLFGKVWFDRVKWKPFISRSIPFPLFTANDRAKAVELGISLEELTYGKSVIAQIIKKTDEVLRIYLNGNCCKDKPNKLVGGYITFSIKNQISRDIGKDLGYKIVPMSACPRCLSKSNKLKTPVKSISKYTKSCYKCKEEAKNLKVRLNIHSTEELKKAFNNASKFKYFSATTCICPNNNCLGKFIPISCLSNTIEIPTSQSICSFKYPKQIIKEKLECPYCDTSFIIEDALNKSSGYKNKSGFLTGLPNVYIWKKQQTDIYTSDDKNVNTDNYNKISKITITENLVILIEEIYIKKYKLNKNTLNGLTQFYFYEACVKWIKDHSEDAYEYFFCDVNNSADNFRGIHIYIFRGWTDLLERNISEFKKYSINKLEDFNWFYKANFNTIMNNGFLNNEVFLGNSKRKSRMGKIISIVKDNIDYTQDIQYYSWQRIKLNDNTNLKNGDVVLVDLLLISGHTASAPIQRIRRLRSKILAPIINKIKLEEKTGKRSIAFWENRKKIVKKVYKEIEEENGRN